MGTITAYGSKHSHEFKLNVNETSYSVENNTSTVEFSLTLFKSSYSWSGFNNISYSISIDGEVFNGTIPSYSAGSTLTIRTGTKTIAHNSDGQKNISYSFNVTDNSGQSYTCGNASASGSMNLTNIPRYTTVYNSLRSKSLNSITIDWSTTDSRDWTQYSLNGGAWTDAGDVVASDNRSGYYTIGGLSPNTTYTIKTRCRRRDSGLWSEATSTLTVTTYDIAKISSQDFNLGDIFPVVITSPSGLATHFYLDAGADNVRIRTQYDVRAGTYNIELTDSEMDEIYKLMGNNSSVPIRVGVRTENTDYYYTESHICTLTGNKKVAKVNVGGSTKRAKAFVKVNGQVKKAVIWINDNGVGRRCL